jgi:hypothetical protein
MLYDYKKINQYVTYLQNIFLKRRNEYNEKIRREKAPSHLAKKDKIMYAPVVEKKISYDSRRVFKNKTGIYGDEYYLFKFCVFIQIFEKMHNSLKI